VQHLGHRQQAVLLDALARAADERPVLDARADLDFNPFDEDDGTIGLIVFA
jgi:hypothetical protein